MIFAVAGGIFLLSFLIGYLSIMSIIPDVQDDEEIIGIKFNKNVFSAAAISSFFSRKNLKSYIFLIIVSIICSATVCLSVISKVGPFTICRWVTVEMMLLSALLIDRKTHLIPNIIVLISLGIGSLILAANVIFDKETFLSNLIISIAGLVISFAVFYLFSRLTKGGIGMGDVKLIAAMGFLLGLMNTLFSVLFALILCAIYSIYLLFMKKKNKDYRIPFGPFIFLGYIILLFIINLK